MAGHQPTGRRRERIHVLNSPGAGWPSLKLHTGKSAILCERKRESYIPEVVCGSVAGKTLDVIALREVSDGCVRPLYDFRGAVDAVCQTSSAEQRKTDAWLQAGKWNSRCPDAVRKLTYDLPRKGSRGTKRRVIDLHGVEELVRELDCASIDTFRQNYGFVECEKEAGSKRFRTADAFCPSHWMLSRSSP